MVQAFLSAAQTLRVAVPCGLNACPPFHTIAETLRPPSILPPAKTVIEDEMRRNTFWLGTSLPVLFHRSTSQWCFLGYAMERLIGTGNGWALSLDDQDICQLLPVRSDQYDQGVRSRSTGVGIPLTMCVCRCLFIPRIDSGLMIGMF